MSLRGTDWVVHTDTFMVSDFVFDLLRIRKSVELLQPYPLDSNKPYLQLKGIVSFSL